MSGGNPFSDEAKRLYELHKAKGQKFSLEAVGNDLEDFVRAHPEVINIRKKLIDPEIKRVDENNRLRPDRNQMQFWPEADLEKSIPTDQEGERIIWGKAEKREIDGWSEKETDNFLKVVSAFETARYLRQQVLAELKPGERVEDVYFRKRPPMTEAE